MKRLVVAQAAQADLRHIARYTEEHWGAAQKDRYLHILRERFAALRGNPAIGTPRDEFGAGLRSLPGGQHVVFYREAPEAIEVLRVLHQSMDVHRHLTAKDEKDT